VSSEPFSTTLAADRDAILDEAIGSALAFEGDGGHVLGRSNAVRGRGHEVSAILAAMRQEKAGFGPHPECLPLAASELEARGLAMDDRLRKLLDRYDFYLVSFAVTLFPRAGWAFDRLECQVAFNPDGPRDRRPLAHDIFPASDWETLAQANMKLEIGVGEDLEFRVKKSLELVPAGVDVSTKLAAGASFVFPPRDYAIKRARIVSRGKEDSEVFWRLDEAKYFEDDAPRLGVILKLPRGDRALSVTGMLAAYRTFQLLSADFRDVVRFMSERVRRFFEAGAPLVDRGVWDLSADLGS